MQKANIRRGEEQIRRGEKMMRRMLGAEFTDELRRAWRALEPEFERLGTDIFSIH